MCMILSALNIEGQSCNSNCVFYSQHVGTYSCGLLEYNILKEHRRNGMTDADILSWCFPDDKHKVN